MTRFWKATILYAMKAMRQDVHWTFFQTLSKKNIDNEKIADIILGAENDYACYTFNDAFKQGFCFAVKSMKFMLKI